MHKHYIINGVVEFHPATSTLRDVNNPDSVVVLNSPAGRCLLLLIERAGSIVTQQEFLDIVWQRRGMLVSSNTYYQNISILRKGLKKIGFNADPIVTIPRIGLTLASDTEITIKETQPRKPETEELHTATAITLVTPEPEVAPAGSQGSSKPGLFLAGILFTMTALAGLNVINSGHAGENHFVDDYHFVTSAGGCRVYLVNDIQTQSDREKAQAYVGQFKDGCGSYPWVYVAWYPMLPRASVIRCDRPMNKPNRCISDYFIEDR